MARYVPLATLSFINAAAILGFLFHNFSPASIFMGDTGSQIVGFLMAFLAIKFVVLDTGAVGAVPFSNAVPILAVSVLIVPLYDTLRITILRMFYNRSPFGADRGHVHHQMLSMGLDHRQVSVTMYMQTLAIIGLTVLLADINVNLLLGVVLFAFVMIFPTYYLKRNIAKMFGFRVPTPRIFTRLQVANHHRKKNGNGHKNGHHYSNEETEEKSREEEEETVSV